MVCWAGKLYQGLDLLLQFEEPLKEYVGIVQNIKVHLESLLFLSAGCNILGPCTQESNVLLKVCYLIVFFSIQCCLKFASFSGLRW